MRNQDNKERSFEVVLSIVCLMLIIYFLTKSVYFLYAGLAIGLLALVSSFLRTKIEWLWTKLLHLIGKVNATLLLGLIFFLLLTPLSFVYRFFNKDPMSLKRKGASAFTDRNHTFSKADLENPW